MKKSDVVKEFYSDVKNICKAHGEKTEDCEGCIFYGNNYPECLIEKLPCHYYLPEAMKKRDINTVVNRWARYKGYKI